MLTDFRRSRIPFATLIFQTVIDVAKRFPSVLITSLVGSLVSLAFAIFWSITMVAVFIKYKPEPNNPACAQGAGGCSNAKVYGLMVFITFSGYWITEVIKNVIHTTV